MKTEYDYKFVKNKYLPIIDVLLKSEKNILLTEAYIDSGATISAFNYKVAKVLGIDYKKDENFSVKLGEDEYFVMGDNRTNSLDSRQLGPINKSYIIGRVWFRGWPVNRINTFNLPSYENIGNK